MRKVVFKPNWFLISMFLYLGTFCVIFELLGGQETLDLGAAAISEMMVEEQEALVLKAESFRSEFSDQFLGLGAMVGVVGLFSLCFLQINTSDD